MEITTKGRYALRTMIDIAKNDGKRVCLAEVSKRQGISEKYLEKIISILTKSNLLKGTRGKSGGYVLTKPPKNYTLAEILQATGDKTALVSCLNDFCCPRENNCDTKSVWGYLDSVFNLMLDKITLQDVIDKKYPEIKFTKNHWHLSYFFVLLNHTKLVGIKHLYFECLFLCRLFLPKW